MPMGQSAMLPMETPPPMAVTPTRGPAPEGAPAPAPSAGAMPPPAADAGISQPPYNVRLQPDGSSVYELPSPAPGMPAIVIGVNPAPHLPKSLQAPKPTA